MDGKRWWWIAVAALLAILLAADSIGLAAGLGLAVAIAAGAVSFRFYRRRNPKRAPEVFCLRCGATLLSTARQCKFCGSASWSMKN
jgi:hypothetical protein